MACVMKEMDVLPSGQPFFLRGIRIGSDLARDNKDAVACKKEAVNRLYHKQKRPVNSEKFWEFQGAMTGIYSITGVCPHCGHSGPCEG